MNRHLLASLAIVGSAALPFVATGCETLEETANDYKSQAFNKADTDGDGLLTKPEFAESDYAKKVTGELDDAFNDIDTDGDGGISLPEIEKAAMDYVK